MTSRARSTPRTAASSSSASGRGASQPARPSVAAPPPIASRTVTVPAASAVPSGKRPLLQPPALLVVLERGAQLVELAEQDLIEVVQAQSDAVIRDSALAI